MIDLYFAPTPNGWQAAIMLEETGLNYRPVLMRLSEGDQFSPEFLAISPNAKMQDKPDLHELSGEPLV
jgi:GST-like protein